MKTKIYLVNGEKGEELILPEFFSKVVRADLIQKIIEAKKITQPYAPSPVAGNQHSASGKLKHLRHVWKSQYGRGMSRIPRKQLSRKGSQFNWVGATVPNTRGGRRAHPPKVLSMISSPSINKKELKLALMSAISATADKNLLSKRYETLKDKKVDSLPIIVESKFTELKIKELLQILNKILGTDLYNIGIKKKSIRAGLGKLRGRKYKSNAGLLFVMGKDEKLKTKLFEVQTSDKLSVVDLARGGPARLTIYTKQAIKELGEKLK